MSHAANEDDRRHNFDQVFQIGKLSISKYSLAKKIALSRSPLRNIIAITFAIHKVRSLIAELQRAKRASEALLVRKIGNLSSRENLVLTSQCEYPSSVQTLGEGEGPLNVTCDFGCSQLIAFIHLLRSLSHPN